MARQKTILLAEDDLAIREEAVKNLTSQGYHILEAEDGVTAVRLYNQHSVTIDVILSDLELPKMHSSEFARYNYENHFLPFIVLASADDAKSALKLIEFGVHDYLEKPFQREQLLSVIDNAINRGSVKATCQPDRELFAQSLETITFPSQCKELNRANRWILDKVSKLFDEHECDRFMNFLDEILFNAHEHGNLGITEEEKTALIQAGKFQQEVERLEKGCNSSIRVSVSVLSDMVSIKVSDEGKGFDYRQYMKMSEDDLLERIPLPNGRGIYMARKYFDMIEYQNNGTTVLLTKHFCNK